MSLENPFTRLEENIPLPKKEYLSNPDLETTIAMYFNLKDII